MSDGPAVRHLGTRQDGIAWGGVLGPRRFLARVSEAAADLLPRRAPEPPGRVAAKIASGNPGPGSRPRQDTPPGRKTPGQAPTVEVVRP